ncbi:MAG: undecaprenyl-diphosphate phosphatase [Candidatus Brocadiaceae bacterium]|nr:undecaprenyl-diphosphate phosphatase [Candidatus Brocadiaceae bacterium]
MIKHVILGLLQGLTEFLPVSSSGHLVILKNYLQVNEGGGALLEITLHVGTLISIFAVFWKDIYVILKGVIISLFRLCKGWKFKQIWLADPSTRLFSFIMVGTIPTGIIAILFEEKFESLFDKPFLAAIAIIITGIILWFTKSCVIKSSNGKSVNIFHALVIGTVQGLAITPGMSRSGLTISAATYMGVDRKNAVRYSFLLCVPAIIGAAVLQVKKMAFTPDQNFLPLLTGAIVACLTGYIALQFLVRIVQQGRLYIFSYYCWGFGIASATFFLVKPLLHK